MGEQILATHQGPCTGSIYCNIPQVSPGPDACSRPFLLFPHPWGLSLPSQAPKQELDRLRGGTGFPVHPASPGTRRRRHRPLMALGFGSRARTAPLAPKVTPARNRAKARARAHAPPTGKSGSGWKLGQAQARSAKAAGNKAGLTKMQHEEVCLT